jgi:amidohydrolase
MVKSSEDFLHINQWDVALKIHEFNEIGSQEFKSAQYLANILRARGFQVKDGYAGIPTAFRAEKIIGKGGPVIAFLAEYDALPGIGHACGHNLIAASALFSAIRATEKLRNGKIVVIGTPDEEGSGEFSGSKILMANKGYLDDIDLVLGSHPGDSWDVGRQSLAVQDFEITFSGIASHEAADPDSGRSALDAAILTYTGVNMMRQHVRRDLNVVIHGIVKEGGTASNVTPEKAVLVYGIRSSSVKYHGELVKRFKKIVEGCANATETTYKIKEIGPLFATTKINPTLSNFIRDRLLDKGVQCPALEETFSKQPGGSTDFANVSQVKPALEVDFQIADEGTPWHSHVSLEAAISSRAKKILDIVIEVLSDTAYKFSEDVGFRERIKIDFLSP